MKISICKERDVSLIIPLVLIFISIINLRSFAQTQDQDFYLFLLIGQSNMAGRGEPEAIDTTIHPRVYMFNQDQNWVPAREPLHFDKPAVAGVGPGFQFGKELAAAFPDKKIGLIPAAVGGSSILTWKEGGYHQQTKSYPYDEAVARALSARKDGVIEGIIWHQGESDSSPEGLGYYEQEMKRLVNQLRDTLHLPDLPFVAGKMGKYYFKKKSEAKSINKINQQLTRKIKNFRVVNAAGVKHKGDGTHLNSPSARNMGQRYARQMLRLME